MPASPPGVLATLIDAGYPLAPLDASPTSPAVPLEVVAEPAHAAAVVRAYTAWLGVRHDAAGGACATQHYAGRVAGYVIGTWAFTGRVTPLRGAGLLAEIDEHGRTTRLLVPSEPEGPRGSASDAVTLLQEHVQPLLGVARSVSHITERLAWGGVATSVAGAVVRALRVLPEPRRTDLLGAAHDALSPARWPTPRTLVTLAPDGSGHRRHTCCLIFLSPDHEECATCPRHTARPATSDRPRHSSSSCSAPPSR